VIGRADANAYLASIEKRRISSVAKRHAEVPWETETVVRPPDHTRVGKWSDRSQVRLGMEEIRLHGVSVDRVELHSADTEVVTIDAEIRAYGSSLEEAEDLAKEIELWTDREASRLWVRAALLPPAAASVRLYMTVPHGVTVRGFSDEMEVKGFSGTLGVRCNRASVTDLSGSIRISEDTIGEIRMERVRGTVTVKAINANVTINDWIGEANVETVLGSLSLRNGSGVMRLESQRGDVTAEHVTSSRAQLTSRRGNVVFAGTTMPGGSYKMETKSGDVCVLLSERSDCGLFAETQSGDLTFTLPSRDFGELPAEGRKRIYSNVRLGSGSLEASSESGNVTVAPYTRNPETR